MLSLHGITWTADLNFFALTNVEQYCSAIVFDLPNNGVGLSVEALTFDDVADNIVAVLDWLGLPRISMRETSRPSSIDHNLNWPARPAPVDHLAWHGREA